jgi:hypothetical protein
MGKKNSSSLDYSAVHGKLMALGNYPVLRKSHSIKISVSDYLAQLSRLNNAEQPSKTRKYHLLPNCSTTRRLFKEPNIGIVDQSRK